MMSHFFLWQTGHWCKDSSRAAYSPLGPPGAFLTWSQLCQQFSEKMLLDGWEEGVDQGLWGLSPSNSTTYHSAKIMVCVQYLIMVA